MDITTKGKIMKVQCQKCHKIRNEKGEWIDEGYTKNIEASHSWCKPCFDEKMEEIRKRKDRK